MRTIFDLCQPRTDVLEGRIRDEEFAADLYKVVNNTASPEYADPAVFFKYTYPTRGLKTLLESVCRRLSGAGRELNSVIRLDTQYGGGKTHSLIALVHAVRGMQGVPNAAGIVDPSLLPTGNVRVAALDGENADPANGLRLEDGLYARSLWGEMAYRLAGREGYERLRRSDEDHVAPGAGTIAELFGHEPALILIDEISAYLRKVARVFPAAVDQFTAFMQALIKAVSSTPKAALVCTLAIRAKDQEAADAYKAEHQAAVVAFEEAESIASRTLLQLDPTEEDETIDVLRRRLFESVDLHGAEDVLREYFALWERNKDFLSPDALSPELRDQFRKGYPLHPETMNVMMTKLSSLSTFQRTRGMLRLLARTVHHLWRERPSDAFAVHPHHIDPGCNPIRSEFTTKLGQGAYTPALNADVASVQGMDPSTAQYLDQRNFPGQTPVTSYVARTIFINTMAYGDAAQGITPEHLRYSVCSPALEPALIEAARKLFIEDSLFLDDRPGAPMRLRVEPNLTQIISRAMKEVDPDELRNLLNRRIKDLFTVKSGDFEIAPFPAGPYEIPDDAGNGRPYLVVLNYDALSILDPPRELPPDLVRMATCKGVNDDMRILQNNLIFIVADQRLKEDMKQALRRRMALEAIRSGPRMKDLADYQQRRLNEECEKTGTTVAISILQCYRHLFYPSAIPIGSSNAKLGHTIIELHNASDSPGNGQLHIKRALREQKKLLTSGDQPDAPTFVRDQTRLNTKGEISTAELRSEFRKAPRLSILLSDDPLVACIRLGIEQGVFIYRRGDLVWGKGDPAPSIEISENAFVHTSANAEKLGIWPRKEPDPEPAPLHQLKPEPVGGQPPAAGPRPQPKSSPPAAPPVITAEGPLHQALTELFEKARKCGAVALSLVRFRFYEYKGAGAMHQTLAVYRDADVICSLEANVEADGVEAFEIRFDGRLDKASPVKSFVESQIRAASNHDFQGGFELRFHKPLPTDQGKAGAFISAMTKYGGAEAYVEAEAAPQEKG
jgi:hypothetical protein